MATSRTINKNLNQKKSTEMDVRGGRMLFLLVLVPCLLVAGCNFPLRGTENQILPDATIAPLSMPGSISGVFWHDLCDNSYQTVTPPEGCVGDSFQGSFHANGIFEPGEPGIEGVEVTLGVGICPAKGVDVVMTGSLGEYQFENLVPGVYCVAVNNGSSHNALLEPGMWTYPKADGGLGVGWITVTVGDGEDVQGVNFGWDYYLRPNSTPPEPNGTPIPEQICTDHVTFVTDVTYPDWTTVEVGQSFKKIWRLKNTGTCTWNLGYSLVFQSGVLTGTSERYPLPREVVPGDVVELSAHLIAPQVQGDVQSYWMIQNEDGRNFGIGENGDKPFWAKVKVGINPSPTAVISWTPRLDPGELATEGRWIDVDLGDQKLTAYEGSNPVMTFLVSTGTASYPTVTGQFRIWVKLESTRMTGPGYDLEDVPYTMYFYEGYGLHGAYWHNNFGTPMSHGCVNLSPSDSAWLFNFASVGTLVNIHS
jgi:hypothetical protein